MPVTPGHTATAQDIIKSSAHYAADAGATDAYAISLPTAPSAYADGLTVRFKANTLNTGPATLNVNSIGAIAILRPNGSALLTGDIVANQLVEVTYRSGNFYLMSPLARSVKFNAGTTTRAGTTASGTQTIAHGLGVAPSRVRFSVFALADNSGIGTTELVNSLGYSDGSNNYCVNGGAREGTTTAQNDNVGVDASNCIALNAPAGGGSQTALATFDATNITLTWTKGGTGMNAANISILWEAEV